MLIGFYNCTICDKFPTNIALVCLWQIYTHLLFIFALKLMLIMVYHDSSYPDIFLHKEIPFHTLFKDNEPKLLNPCGINLLIYS